MRLSSQLSLFVLLCGVQINFIAKASQPDSFDLGRSVDAAEIAVWDLDARPDGEGLPQGQGSVQQGEQLYVRKCAFCHGQNGEGEPFDALVGRIPNDAFPFGRDPGATKTIGNYWPYASTVFDYINRAMPFDAPGSLEADEVYALVAFLLYKNQIVPVDAVLSAENLAAINMPSQQRFIPDDRRGGPEVR